MYHVLKLIKCTAVSYAVIESESKIQKQLKRYFSIIACIVGIYRFWCDLQLHFLKLQNTKSMTDS